ncbi:MAG: prephenate dehydrogenase [Ruminococcaceae bacterium]|nr:prephenate dehydrogenase [Oscillospiraceae bacterium]
MKQKIGMIGLGLMGASFAKSIRKADAVLYGFDIHEPTLRFAREERVIDEIVTRENLGEIDILFLAVYPSQILSYMRKNARFLKPGAIVCDFCGVKGAIERELLPLCRENELVYIGGHPMAGKERWGYAYADDTLFENASMLLVPSETATNDHIEQIKGLCDLAGFGRVVCTTSNEHDKIIAYTSQLAHVVSGAYMKSETAEHHDGFSAGSYRDLTRVAKLNENMWTELFLKNRENLISEIDEVVLHLNEYREALAREDEELLKTLIREARERKERLG